MLEVDWLLLTRELFARLQIRVAMLKWLGRTLGPFTARAVERPDGRRACSMSADGGAGTGQRATGRTSRGQRFPSPYSGRRLSALPRLPPS